MSGNFFAWSIHTHTRWNTLERRWASAAVRRRASFGVVIITLRACELPSPPDPRFIDIVPTITPRITPRRTPETNDMSSMNTKHKSNAIQKICVGARVGSEPLEVCMLTSVALINSFSFVFLLEGARVTRTARAARRRGKTKIGFREGYRSQTEKKSFRLRLKRLD